MRVFWKTTGIVVAVLGAVTLGLWLWIDSVAGRKWSAMARRVEELKAEANSPEGPRPVLHGEPLEGDPWEDYSWAVGQLVVKRGAGELRVLAGELVEALDVVDRSKVPAGMIAMAVQEAAVDRMRQGSRRTEWGRSPSGLRIGYSYFGYTSSPAGILTLVALNRARTLQSQARWGESAHLLLEVAQFASDIGHDGDEHVALWIHSMVAGELRRLMVSGQLSSTELALADRDLEVLDRSLFSHDRLVNQYLVDLGSFLLERGEMIHYQVSIGTTECSASGQRTWRYGFSKRLTCATAFAWADHWLRRTEGCDRTPWSEVHRLEDELSRDAMIESNPVAKEFADQFVDPVRGGRRREALARLRLLRLAAHYLSTGELLEIEDPFGTRLLHATRDGKLKAWSMGPNGTDEGGYGDWLDHKNGDIVLEVQGKP